MISLAELLSLRDRDANEAAAFLEVDVRARHAVSGYGSLDDVDALDGPTGVRLYLRGDKVVLVYAGSAGLPAGTDHKALVAEAGASGTTLRSRQGKLATMHVVPEAGMAWSELDGAVGWLELFQPTTLERYLDEIHEEPPLFRQQPRLFGRPAHVQDALDGARFGTTTRRLLLAISSASDPAWA